MQSLEYAGFGREKTQLTIVSMETVRMAKFPTKKEKIKYFTNSVFQVFRLHAFFLYPPSVLHESYHISTSRRLGVLPEKLGGGVQSASQNPCAIYEKIWDVRYPI